MTSLSSHIILTQSAQVLRNSAIHFSEDEIRVSGIFEGTHESANTIFCDGIISPSVISISHRNISITTFANSDFKVLNLNTLHLPLSDLQNTIIDFGTENISEINLILQQKIKFLQCVSSIDFILACTVYPLLELNNRNIDYNNCRWILWTDTDLINKQLTQNTEIKELFVK
jgi:hypothetical protein